MFFEFKHGGHALTPEATKEDDQRQQGRRHRGRPWHVVTPQQAGDDFDLDSMTPFRYLVETNRPEDFLPVGQATVAALDALGKAMAVPPPPPAQEPSGTDPVDRQDQNPDSTIPPIFTYWSQFIDHELTARTDRDAQVSDITVDDAELKPADRQKVEWGLLNRRTPALELDCLYGDGPPGPHGDRFRHKRGRNIDLARRLRDGAKMRVGTAEVVLQPDTAGNPAAGKPAGDVPPRETDLNRDLPRIGALLDQGVVRPEDFPESLQKSETFRQRAFIGDPRNDENLIVAQFHTAMLRFHNAVVDWLQSKGQDERKGKGKGKGKHSEDELFEDARRVVRWTFQWLTVNQFLPRLLKAEVVQQVIQERAQLYRKQLRETREPFMPVEFSVACYRFGHSMIRNVYDYNRNFGRAPEGGPGRIIPNATLDLLFLFTGKSKTPFDPRRTTPQKALPHNWIIEWDRFDGRSALQGGEEPTRFARKIDTQLAPRLGKLPNEGTDEDPTGNLNALLQHLARRNLRRGYQLALPTGQALARAVGVEPLTRDELSRNSSADMNKALEDGGFFDRTPLWFYVLKEAEVKEGGERLGALGSRIVAETFIGVLLADSESYLSRDPGWDPSRPVADVGGPVQLPDGRPIKEISDLLRFAGVAV